MRRPVAAVIAVVIRGGCALLVRRRNPPDQGRWGFPGGKVDFGETLGAAALRELFEETGIEATAGPVITAVDVIGADHHYVLVAVPCHWRGGEPRAGDDAEAAAWFALDALEGGDLPLSAGVARLARRAAALLAGETS
ncbi:NUDIX hydrolase [Zavarzinia compransoris]|nr:NUDIX hydrolase [Zavarzinia compransoris]